MAIDRYFLAAAVRRAIHTVLQTALAMIPAASAIPELTFGGVFVTALFAGTLSAIKSVAFGMPEAAEPEGGGDR